MFSVRVLWVPVSKVKKHVMTHNSLMDKNSEIVMTTGVLRKKALSKARKA